MSTLKDKSGLTVAEVQAGMKFTDAAHHLTGHRVRINSPRIR